MIRQHILKNSFHEALEVLKSQKITDLYYQFAPILIQEIPKHMVKVIIDQGRKLSPLKLLPAMVICNSELHAMEIIKYFEYCVNDLKNTDKAVHNFLLSLYAKYDPKKLMDYLKSQGTDINMVSCFLHVYVVFNFNY